MRRVVHLVGTCARPISSALSPDLARLRDWLRDMWRTTSRWLRAFWVARVSTASVLLGLVLMMAVPQARDVFADTSLGAVKWTVFFVVLFLFWAVPVHYAARRALAWDHWAIGRDQSEPLTDSERQRLQELYETPARWVPRILGICCFVAVLRGLGAAADNLEQAQALHEADAALVQIGWLKVWTWLSLALFVLFVLRRRAWFVHLGIKGVSGATDYRPASAGVVNQPYALVDGDLLWFR